MEIKSVLFDMDGVLLDSEPGAFRMMQESLAKIGIHETLEDLLRDYTGLPSREGQELVLRKHNSTYSVDDFRRVHYARGSFYEVSEDVKPFEGLVDFMKALEREGVTMAMVSATEAWKAITAINRMKLTGFFDALVCGDMIKKSKPDPEGYLKAAGYLGTPPEQCVVVEDTPVGIRAGHNAGMFVVGYKGSIHVQDTSEADLEVNSYGELLAWFREQKGNV